MSSLSTDANAVAALRERVGRGRRSRRRRLGPGPPGLEPGHRRAARGRRVPPRTPARSRPRSPVAQHHRLRVAPQGTGHNAGPLGDLARDTVLLRTDRMPATSSSTPPAGIARVGAGVLWEEVTAPAGEHGLIALHGSSPNVGVVGYSLGGGIGWLARSHGLATTRVTAIEIVTPTGRDHPRRRARASPSSSGPCAGAAATTASSRRWSSAYTRSPPAYAGWFIWPWERSPPRCCARGPSGPRTVPDEMTPSVGPHPADPRPALRARAAARPQHRGRRGGPTPAPRTRSGSVRNWCGRCATSRPRWTWSRRCPAPAMVRLHQDPEPPTPGVGEARR